MRFHRAVFALMTILSLSQQDELLAKSRPKWTMYGLRPLGMGNAFVAVADDYNTLFYNPAGIARLKSWDGELINPFVDASSGFNGVYQDSTSSSNSGVSGVLDLIEKNAGESFHVGLGLAPHLIFPKFGFALGLEPLDTSVVFHRDISVDVQSGSRFIVPFTFGKNFLDDRLSVGLTVKARAQAGVDREFSIDDIEALQNGGTDSQDKKLNDYATTGYGLGADIGMLFTPTKTMEPTLGISVTDLGGTSFKEVAAGTDGVGVPSPILPSVNVGFSMKPVMINKLYILTAVDMHSINQPFSFSKKFNAGAELGYGSIIKIQAGLYQGYFTGGFQFDVGLVNLRLVTYSEELGDNAGFKEDRRYAIQLKLI